MADINRKITDANICRAGDLHYVLLDRLNNIIRSHNAAFTPAHMLPRNMYPGRATCIRIHICRRTHVAGYKLLVRDTCGLYLGDIITIHLCHGRLVIPLYRATDGRQTGDNFVTDTRYMSTVTSVYLYPATCVLV